jgi:hypothetical protein
MKNKTISNSFAFVKRAIAFVAAVCIFTTGAAPAVHATPPSYPTGQPPEIHTIPQIFENFVVEWSFNPTDIASSDFYTVWNASVAGVTDWIVEKAASLYTESGTLIAEYNNAESQFVFKVPIKFEQPVSIDTAQDLEVGGKVGIGISDAPSGLLDILGGEPSYLSLPTLQPPDQEMPPTTPANTPFGTTREQVLLLLKEKTTQEPLLSRQWEPESPIKSEIQITTPKSLPIFQATEAKMSSNLTPQAQPQW